MDLWAPGEHNGTFRGHCPAFVTATAALQYWANDQLSQDVARKAKLVERHLHRLRDTYAPDAQVRGRGLIWGIEFSDPQLASRISQACFGKGLIIETAGIEDQVLKLLPSLTMGEQELRLGLQIIEDALKSLVAPVQQRVSAPLAA
jgi:diaminobutyrate-2-oxoglutarate transaminase